MTVKKVYHDCAYTIQYNPRISAGCKCQLRFYLGESFFMKLTPNNPRLQAKNQSKIKGWELVKI